jgi:hypothetical protein
MRRNWIGALLFALALALQALTPAAAGVARSGAASPYEFCWQAAASADAGDLQDRHSGLPGADHRHGCLFCQLSCDGAALLTPNVSSTVVAPFVSRSADFSLSRDLAPPQRRDNSRRARAPPIFS